MLSLSMGPSMLHGEYLVFKQKKNKNDFIHFLQTHVSRKEGKKNKLMFVNIDVIINAGFEPFMIFYDIISFSFHNLLKLKIAVIYF